VVLILVLLGILKGGPSQSWGLVERLFAEFVGPVQRAARWTTESLQNVWEGYVALTGVRQENLELKKQLQALQISLNSLREEAESAKRLRKLLNFTQTVEFPMLPAQVVGRDPSGWFKTLLIDKGEQDGIRAGMAVVNHEGVVGRVIAVSAHYAKVLLLIDINSAVDALIQETRYKGIVAGFSEKFCELKYLSPLQKVTCGEHVVTSGLNRFFPKGLPLGRIIKVDSETSDMFQKILVEPAVDFSRLEEVLVITKNEPTEGELP
jgi:rod shape-determining protein MreC